MADALFLYDDAEKLVVMNAERLKGVQKCLPRPTRVLWCSFSPDGTRLASCTSDGFINLWNVDMCQVYQRFKSNVGASSAACWWSDRFLFVFCFIHETPGSLSKYSVDENCEVTTTQGQSVSLCPVISEFSLFSRIVDFSEGYLSFECGETKPVKVLDVNRIGPPESVILPGISPKMEIAVSSGACFVLGIGGTYLWKRNTAQPTTYDVCNSYRVPQEKRLSCFSSKLAVVSCIVMMDQVFQRRLKFTVIALETETFHFFPPDTLVFMPGMEYVKARRLFCSNMKLILVGENFISIFDLAEWETSRNFLSTTHY